MAIVEAKILGTSYNLACGEGEETRLLNLAHKLNNRLKKIASSNPRANELKLMVLAALTIEDELEDTKNSNKSTDKSEIEMVEMMDSVSAYIENLVEKIKHL